MITVQYKVTSLNPDTAYEFFVDGKPVHKLFNIKWESNAGSDALELLEALEDAGVLKIEKID